jgi:DNA-binding PadR family transcriptional regulator
MDLDGERVYTNPLADCTMFQIDLLIVLAEVGPAKGARVGERLSATRGLVEINAGQLYPNLDTLVDRGLVTKQAVNRRANHYALSRRGEHALADFRAYVARSVDSVDADGGDA